MRLGLALAAVASGNAGGSRVSLRSHALPAMFRLGLVLVAVLAVPASAQAPPPPPWGLTRVQEGDGPLAILLRLRDAEAEYRAYHDREGDDGRLWSQYTQVRAAAESAAGNHAEALRWFDVTTAYGRDSVGVLPAGVHAVDATAYVAGLVESAQVVMVNEAHHDASSRLLTLRLLPVLYDKGFRYFAAETFNVRDVGLNARGYPVDTTGAYTSEPVFAALVREALRLGYTLVPYEIERADEGGEGDTLNGQQRRDYEQARHLAERTVELDPEARVLVHAGYAHIQEVPDEWWTPMAYYFRQRTGIDPLTVDQTTVGEMSEPRFEHPAYRAADVAGLLGSDPVVLLDADGVPLAYRERAVDVQVIRPRAGDVAGRPAWMATLPGRDAHDVELPEACSERVCLVRATVPGESTEAVPLDQAVAAGQANVRLYLPTDGAVRVEVLDGRTGDVLSASTVGDD